MAKIRVETERLKVIATHLEEHNNDLYAIRCRIAASTYYIEKGAKNWSVQNITGKMNALTSEMSNLVERFDGIIAKLNDAVVQNEEISTVIQSKIPDWAIQIPSGYEGRRNYYKGEDGIVNCVFLRNAGNEISCTYFTMWKLRERNLGFPFKTGQAGEGNGGKWFNNCSIDDKYKFAGSTCLEDMYGEYGKYGGTLNNVVVSFMPPSGNSTGHVVLLDEIYKDSEGTIRVKWTDMGYPFDQFYDPNEIGDRASNAWDMTLEDFESKYKMNECVGAVLVGDVTGKTVEIDSDLLNQIPGETTN